MTKYTFELLLKCKGIGWNDMVNLYVFNPNSNILKLAPKILEFYGAIGYKKDDDYVSIMCLTENGRCQDYVFDFDQIAGIKLIRQ